ncbi:cupin domain-containing protein [Prodigiosinella aquatilis]|nr:cupin domain-containing protein [Prodigiosinella sp. LS101]WJV53228.1 cupin domain-containing protein [Prodigiosinella sp. LS101]WJV57588.1 cupin domain-containing protein [Pectobacteriaceae bacterium C111]
MKESIQLHLNKNTISPWSIDKVLSERAFSNFIESFYRQEVFSGSAIGHFSDLFNINSLVELLNTRRLSFPRCRLIRQGTLIPPASYTVRKGGSLGEAINTLDVTKVSQLIDEGTTLAIDFCEDLWEEINDVCGDFSTLFSEKTGATLFFSSGKEVGFTAHWDNSDVIVYQLSGKKRWKIYSKSLDMPIDENKDSMPPHSDIPFLDLTLEANNVLYIPRGYWHAPEPCGEHSLHVSFAFRRRNGMDYLKWLIPKLCDELVVRKDIDRHADLANSTEYINGLKSALCEHINDSTLRAYIESCDRRDLKNAVFTGHALLKE